MRNISSNGLTKLATRLATEPINILEIEWAVGKKLSYADRDVATIPGKIQEIAPLDNVIDTSISNSQNISVKLDDVDGTIKTIMDQNDVHQRDVWVYQHFDGLDLADKFLLFRGKISSPIVWSESERTVSFTVVSQIEDKEIGFSAEEGQFPYLPYSMVGKAWPIIFGTVLDVPALQVNQALKGTTMCGVGIISGQAEHLAIPLGSNDCSFFFGIAQQQAQANHLQAVADCFGDSPEGAQMAAQAEKMFEQIGTTLSQHTLQQQCAQQQRSGTLTDAIDHGLGCNPVTILGGEDFPQNKPITINIGGGLFTGTMHGNLFTISSRTQPENEATAAQVAAKTQSAMCQSSPPTAPQWRLVTEIPCTCNGFFAEVIHGDDGCFGVDHGFAVCLSAEQGQPNADQVAQHSWYEPGSAVSLASNQPITYIVSIVPGTVLAVKAFKTFQGPRKLVDVPKELYTVQTKVYGDITAVQIVLNKPLSTVTVNGSSQGWEDEIYVTFQSSVGPSMVNILEYIIDRWTDLTFDATSFNHVKSMTDIFPMNFPILDRKNTLEVLKDIAFQGRCALWMQDGVFYLKYLPEEPDADDTITTSDILPKSLEVELTATEDLVTKMIVQWHLSWAFQDNQSANDPKPLEIILRHNVNKYGVKEQTFDFYCYNQPDIVLKAATFWLIRKANTWKKLRFKTPLSKLNLETYDTVSVPAGYVGSAETKCIVSNASYDSDSNTIAFECITPIKSGELAPYLFFWPKDISAEFPTPAEIKAGNGGGVDTGLSVLPIGSTDGIGQGGTIFVGGPNIVFLANSSRGDRTPGDVGFTAQTVTNSSLFANVTGTTNPNPYLKLNYARETKLPPPPTKPEHSAIIDINKTRIRDGSSGTAQYAKLKSLIEKIKDSTLFLKGTVHVADNSSNEGTFEMKWDSDGSKFAAERAYLVDDG